MELRFLAAPARAAIFMPMDAEQFSKSTRTALKLCCIVLAARKTAGIPPEILSSTQKETYTGRRNLAESTVSEPYSKSIQRE